MPIRLRTIRKPSAAEVKGVKAEVKPIPARTVAAGVVHLDLRLAVMQAPHAARMRKTKYVGKPVKRSHQAQLWYRSQLLSLVSALKKNTNTVLIPALREDFAAHNNWTQDAPKMSAKNASRNVKEAQRRNRESARNIDAVATRITNTFVQRNLKSVDTRLAAIINNSLGINIKPAFTNDGSIRDKVRAATEANVALIKSIPVEYHDAIDAMVTEGYTEGRRFDGLESGIKRIGDVTDSRAHLIARDQTSKLTSAFNMARQTSLGIEEYQWQGVGDERERETHVENNGRIFRWDSPPEETGHPGDDVNCRCDALPVFNFENYEDDGDE
jgi:SPP1 gp7 family putative phage head morphogenesis protein